LQLLPDELNWIELKERPSIWLQIGAYVAVLQPVVPEFGVGTYAFHPGDRIDTRRSALVMARSVLRDIREGTNSSLTGSKCSRTIVRDVTANPLISLWSHPMALGVGKSIMVSNLAEFW